MRVADGAFIFVQMTSGQVGVVAEGLRAVATLKTMTGRYRTTPLDIFAAAGGDRSAAPDALLLDYSQRLADEGSFSSLPPLGTMPVSSALTAGESELGEIAGAACLKDTSKTYENFEFWWSQSSYQAIGGLDTIGAHSKEGHGIWSSGPANLTLGSTSAGAAVVCFPQGESETQAARITVQESLGNGIWQDLWTNSFVFDGVAYGYWFRGFMVHKIRVLIRDSRPSGQQSPTIGPFYWGAAY